MFIDDFKSIGERAERFGRAKEQRSSLVQREVEEGQHSLLRGRLQINQQVSTADEIDAREWGVTDHIVLRKHDHLAQFRNDLVGVASLHEVPGQPIV